MNKNLTPKRTIQQLLLIKRRLFKLGRSFLQLLIIVFVGLPVMVLMFIFPSLRRRLLPKTKLDFLVQVLRVTEESKGDSKVIYPFLQQNLDKLDDNFADILRNWATATFSEVELLNWATAKFSEVEADVAESIALCIGQFSNCIKEFPLGSKANNMEISIAGYEVVLKVFAYKSHREIWATIQNNLGAAYRDRIRGDKAENIEAAIAAYSSRSKG